MDDCNYILVFFDTFSHGQKLKIQLDSIKFSQPVKIGLIRIIPFGVAIESELDNEARHGITDPQKFNIKFFTHKGDELPSFDKIGEIDFDEKNGVNSINFPSMPLASILSVSGCYNTLSIAVFGIISPRTISESSNMPIIPQANPMLSGNVPPQNVTNPNFQSSNQLGFRSLLGPNPPSLNLMNQQQASLVSTQVNSTNHTNMLLSFALAAGGGNNPMNFMRSPQPSTVSTPAIFNQDMPSIVKMEPLKLNQQTPFPPKREPMMNQQMLISSNSNNNSNLNVGNMNVIKNEPDMLQACTYEDGEIQEIDYEDVSSNDEILFDMDDEFDFMGLDPELETPQTTKPHTSKHRISTGFPDLDDRLVTERWRFQPKRALLNNQLFPQHNKHLRVIPDSSMTLYEVEYGRLCRQDEQGGRSEEISPAANDLINLVSKYGSNNITLDSEWVKEMEKLPNIIGPGLAYLMYADKQTAENVMESLVTWTKLGLSPHSVLTQSDNLFILRHLRAGISLAGYLCSLEPNLCAQYDLFNYADDFHIQHVLFDLLVSPLQLATAPPVQLEIIRALDLSTRLEPGLKAFVDAGRSSQPRNSPYKRLINFLLDSNVEGGRKLNSRILMACTRLLNKLHLYEALVTLRDNVVRLRLSLNESSESLHLVTECNRLLTEIIRYFINASEMIANPRRSMPCASIFDNSVHKPHNPYPNILHMFHITGLLESVDWIISMRTQFYYQQQQYILNENTSVPSNNTLNFQSGSRIDMCHQQMVANCLKLLHELSQKHESLVFIMMSNSDVMERLLKRLLGLEVHQQQQKINIVNGNTVIIQPNPIWVEMGSEICVKIECLRWLDELLDWCKSVGGINLLAKNLDKLEDAKLASILLGLAKLTGERKGAIWISQVLTMDDNLAALLPILEALEKKMIQEDKEGQTDDSSIHQSDSNNNKENSTQTSSRKSRKLQLSPSSSSSRRVPLPHSICLHYMPNLLTCLLRHSNSVGYLGKYGARLARLGSGIQQQQIEDISSEGGAKNNAGPFSEVRDWLQALTDMPTVSPLDPECLGHLIQHLRASLPELDLSSVPPAVASLLTVLRLLKHHCVGPDNAANSNMNCGSGGLETRPNQLLGNGACGDEEEKFVFGLPRELQVNCVRYNYAITEFYHLDGLPLLIKLIQQVVDQHQLSWQCGIEYVDSRFSTLLTVTEAACTIVASVTKRLIMCGKHFYKDTTALQTLFNCYTVFCSDFVSGQHNISHSRYLEQLESIRQSIVSSVISFTQSQLPDEENEKTRNSALEKSLWTCMLRELLNFIVSAPYAFVGGLTLLIELLPLPLPIKSTSPLTDPEICQVRNSRALWSAHLLCCQEELAMMIHQLGCSSNPVIQQLLARLLSLISGMGPAASYSIVRCCLQTLCHVWDTCVQDLEKHNDSIPLQGSTGGGSGSFNSAGDDKQTSSDAAFMLDNTLRIHPDSLELTRTFAMLRLILTIPACKHTFLKLIGQKSSIKSSFDTSESESHLETPFFDIVGSVLKSNKENHTSSQEQLILCLQILLDGRITMEIAPKSEPIGMDDMIFSGDTTVSNQNSTSSINDSGTGSNSNNSTNRNSTSANSSMISNQQLVDGLPNRDQCLKIVRLLVCHCTNNEQDMATIPSALKTLVILVGHDYGFRILYEVLESEEQPLFLCLMKRVNESFSTDNPDCQLTLLTTLNLLQALVLRNRAVPSYIPLEGNSSPGDSASTGDMNAAYRGIGRLTLANIRSRLLPHRTLNFSDDYVKHSLLQWSGGSKEANITHPITELHGLLKIVSEEEESLQVLRDGLESLIELLSKSHIIMGNMDGMTQGLPETMPVPQSLENIFNARGLVWVLPLDQLSTSVVHSSNSSGGGSTGVGGINKHASPWQMMLDDEDRLDEKGWFGVVHIDEEKDAPELSRCDLENLAYVCCNGFNLHEELARGRQKDDEAVRHKKRRRGHDAIIHTGRSTKKFVAPMRGRGFGVRSSATLSNSGNPVVAGSQHYHQQQHQNQSSYSSSTNMPSNSSSSVSASGGGMMVLTGGGMNPMFAGGMMRLQQYNNARFTHPQSSGGGGGLNSQKQAALGISGGATTNIAGIPPGTSLSVNDPFRTRPPNTSRPPSMHVDDFQKLQKDEKAEEEIMIRERNLRSLRGGRAGIRTVNMGNRSLQR